MLRIYAHNVGSEGLNALREGVTPFLDLFGSAIRAEYPAIAHRSSRSVLATNRPDAPCFSGANKVVIGWGNSTPMTIGNNASTLWLNKPENIGFATNKLSFFRKVAESNETGDARDEVTTVDWTTDRSVAEEWLDGETAVYCRTTLQGSAGEGIVVATTEDEMVDAPLYTKGISGARREYRIHVFGGKVILSQTKRRRSGSQTDELVRNLDGGWIFGVSNSNPSDLVKENAINAVHALGLDYGAVDIIAKGGRGSETESYVLEVNTAPGQRGATTVAAYSKALIDRIVKHYAFRANIESDLVLENESVADIINNMFEDTNRKSRMLSAYLVLQQAVADIPDDPADGSDAEVPDARQPTNQRAEPERPTLGSLLTGTMSSNPMASSFSTTSTMSTATIQRAETPQTVAPTEVTRVSALSTAPATGNYYAVATIGGERQIGKVVRRRGRELFYIVGADAPVPMRQVTLESVISLD